jgi:hypothetical protein
MLCKEILCAGAELEIVCVGISSLLEFVVVFNAAHVHEFEKSTLFVVDYERKFSPSLEHVPSLDSRIRVDQIIRRFHEVLRSESNIRKAWTRLLPIENRVNIQLRYQTF